MCPFVCACARLGIHMGKCGYKQWRSQGGGPGGPWPPQTFGKCFFWNELMLLRGLNVSTAGDTQVDLQCTKNVPESRECD